MYTSDYKFQKFQAKFPKTEIQVIEGNQFLCDSQIQGDCLEAALWLMKTYKTNPAVLNMASSSHPK